MIKQIMLEKSTTIKDNYFESLTTSDIALIFKLYDRYFFDDTLCRMLKGRISYRFSNRMTKTGGKVEYNQKKKTYVLVLSYPLIVHSFDHGISSFDVNGVACSDSLDAMMSIMEHEIIHIIEFELNGKSYCSKRPFKTLAYRLFRHTDTKHRLGISEKKKCNVLSMPLGSRVRFNHKGCTYTGILSRVTKRATVVLDSSCNSRYNKFYVPLDQLSVVK